MWRIRSITEAARDAGRQVLVVGRSMKRAISVATELGYMEGLPEYLSEEDYGYIPRENVVMILTGSQGEPRAALAKLARDETQPALTAVIRSSSRRGHSRQRKGHSRHQEPADRSRYQDHWR